MDYKDCVAAMPNKMYTEDGEDITTKYFWDDAPAQYTRPFEQGKAYSQIVGKLEEGGKPRYFEIKDDEQLEKDMQEELKNSFFVPVCDTGCENHSNLKPHKELMEELRDKLKTDDSEVHKKEFVNHPDHYNAGKYETIDIIRDQLTEEEFTGFCLGNAIKYISRCQHKGKMVEDIRKAIWYLEAIIEN